MLPLNVVNYWDGYLWIHRLRGVLEYRPLRLMFELIHGMRYRVAGPDALNHENPTASRHRDANSRHAGHKEQSRDNPDNELT